MREREREREREKRERERERGRERNSILTRHHSAAAGAEASLVTIVTNTKHIEEGEIVVVALPGATVPVGKSVEDGATVVEKASVGGRKSGGSELWECTRPRSGDWCRSVCALLSLSPSRH